MVTPERWQRIKVVLDGTLERQGAERELFLVAACQGDDELRREVEALAAAESEIGDFIETPVFRIRMEEVEPLAVGQCIGAYRVLREIGRGGMGAVYLAERADQEFEQRVAIKVVRRGMDTDEIVRRFRSERQILAHLDHPNIGKLFDGGTTEDGRPYFVMEYVEGQPIDDYCDGRKLPVRERLELFRKVCSAVHFAHQNLIVHRDLKPGNILVTADGVPKLLDFGIAKLLDPNQDLYALTRVELRPMTPEYASPEQVRGETITTASDVYSLGVLLYVLLTGQRPYRPSQRDPQSLVRAICDTDPVRPSSVVGAAGTVGKSEEVRGDQRLLRRRLAGDLDNIVLKAMQKEPARRYASVDQLSGDLGRHLEGLPVIARKDTFGYRARKFVGRHKAGVALAAAGLLLILGFSLTVTVLWQRAVREQQRAQTISGFLGDLFMSPNPSKSRGETVTAREMLDRGVEKIDTDLKAEPEVRARLMETMGRVYRSLGLYEPARKLLEGALHLNRQTLGRNDLLVAQNLQNLADLLHDMGKESEAEPLIREALEIGRKRGATRNIDYARALTHLGELVEDQGKYDQAETLLSESLAIKRKLPDADKQDIAASLNALGKLYETWGKFAAAEPLYQKALAMRRELAGGRPDPEVATSLGNLGSLREDQGNLIGAEVFYRQALEMRRKLFHGPNPMVARALNNLGYVLLAEGKAVEAEKCYREALSIVDEKLSPNHPERASYLRNLAAALTAEGKAAEAEAQAREALRVFRGQQRPVPWRIADAASVLGGSLTAQGRFQEAEPLLVDSYSTLQKDKGAGARRVEAAHQRIADLYRVWRKPEKSATPSNPASA